MRCRCWPSGLPRPPLTQATAGWPIMRTNLEVLAGHPSSWDACSWPCMSQPINTRDFASTSTRRSNDDGRTIKVVRQDFSQRPAQEQTGARLGAFRSRDRIADEPEPTPHPASPSIHGPFPGDLKSEPGKATPAGADFSVQNQRPMAVARGFARHRPGDHQSQRRSRLPRHVRPDAISRSSTMREPGYSREYGTILKPRSGTSAVALPR